MLRAMFSRRWLLLTIITVIAIAVTVRLGIWQLDRLEQRRAFNARVTEQLEQPALVLTGDALDEDLHNMEYREVIVTGVYDQEGEIALRNQHWQNQWGAHLVTPLRIEGSQQAVLVDRGWIPAEAFNSGDWSDYAEPGTVQVRGVIRRSKDSADFGSRSDSIPTKREARLDTWNFINIAGIAQQTENPLLPVYIQQSPVGSWTGLPYRSEPDIEITEGPHMGYAIQWFTFAVIIAAGYPILIRKRMNNQTQRDQQNNTISTEVVHDRSVAS